MPPFLSSPIESTTFGGRKITLPDVLGRKFSKKSSEFVDFKPSVVKKTDSDPEGFTRTKAKAVDLVVKREPKELDEIGLVESEMVSKIYGDLGGATAPVRGIILNEREMSRSVGMQQAHRIISDAKSERLFVRRGDITDDV